MHCSYRTLLGGVFTASLTRSATLPPPFLLPAFAATQSSSFTTSSPQQARRDRNPSRGVSALRRTGPNKKQKLSVKLEYLPRPVLDPAKRSQVEVDEDHGLWDFFPSDRKTMATPEEMAAHGRSWTVPELRNKDWDDLHRLWWVCLKEKNRLRTYDAERTRLGNMYGAHESDKRLNTIKYTMKAIKHTLTERWYAWENARNEAMQDDEINMYADLDKGEAAYIIKSESEDEVNGISAGAQNDLPPPERPAGMSEARL